MRRWNARRAARRPSPPSWPGNAAVLDLPPSTPADLVELARLAVVDGPALLAGRDPARAGLVIVDPRSSVCPDDFARSGRVLCQVWPLTRLVALGRRLGLPLVDLEPELFTAILVGKTRAARLELAPLSFARAS